MMEESRGREGEQVVRAVRVERKERWWRDAYCCRLMCAATLLALFFWARSHRHRDRVSCKATNSAAGGWS